jgi:hypothetical protein
LRPSAEAARHDKSPKDRRQKIKKNERQNERNLFAEVLAQRVLDRQCAGRNFANEENYDCYRDGRNSPELLLITKEITDPCTERATKNYWSSGVFRKNISRLFGAGPIGKRKLSTSLSLDRASINRPRFGSNK